MMTKPNNKFIQLWLIIGLVSAFALIIFFVINYVNESVLCDLDCGAQNKVSLVLVLMSLFGVFIGSFTFYFISERYEKRIGKIHKNVDATFRFLELEQKMIFKSIIKSSGNTTQAKLVTATGLSRVKISRHLKQLEAKQLIEKSKEGMTNKIKLKEDLRSLFL